MLLTVSIPTYNRVEELKETINSLLPQVEYVNHTYGECVNILICDNSSQDGTAGYLNELKNKIQFVDVFRTEENVGIDGNIHNCAVEADGEYVFSLSDDDIPEDGLIEEIVSYLMKCKKDSQSVFVFLNGYTFSGKYKSKLSRDNRIFKDIDGIDEFYDKDEFVECVGVWSTFVSSFVYNRKLWLESVGKGKYIGTDIYLTYALFSMLPKCSKMVIFKKPYIGIRAQYSGNYRILKAFFIEWSNLINNVSYKEFDYDEVTMRRVFKKSFYGNMINKLIDVKYANKSIPDEDISLVYKSLDGYYIEKILTFVFLNMNYKLVVLCRKIMSIFGVKTDNFLL